jgi:inner membrane protein
VTIDPSGAARRTLGQARFLPRDFQVAATVNAEARRRGIFRVPLYRARLEIKGRFVRPDLDWIKPSPDEVYWDQATVTAGVSDPRGLSRRTTMDWGGRQIAFTGGVPDAGLFKTGLRADVSGLGSLPAGTDLPFGLTLEINGSHDIRFLPAAEETTVTVQSPWPHPSFSGGLLPEERTITDAGFSARWRATDFGRAYPSRWVGSDVDVQQLSSLAESSTFGVALIQPVDIYQQAERAVKYAVLFLALTFMVFFLWEVLHTARLHPVQYAFVGFALCLFYLLLVSLSEHSGFDPAYAVSSVVTTLLIGGYSRAVLRGTKQGASVVAALASLYGFLYLLLRLEDYALLAGTVGLFFILSIVMFVTRRMDWYGLTLDSR